MVVTVRLYRRTVRRSGNELLYFIPDTSGYVTTQINLSEIPRERLAALFAVNKIEGGLGFNSTQFAQFVSGIFTSEQIQQIVVSPAEN